MTSAKILMYLRERDRADARGDLGIVRSTTFELRRLGVRDDATLVHPGGAPARAVAAAPPLPTPTVEERVGVPPEVAVEIPVLPAEPPKAKGGRPRLPRCEHDQIAERCALCNDELAAH